MESLLKFIEFNKNTAKQGSDEWLLDRKRLIGGSEISSFLKTSRTVSKK